MNIADLKKSLNSDPVKLLQSVFWMQNKKRNKTLPEPEVPWLIFTKERCCPEGTEPEPDLTWIKQRLISSHLKCISMSRFCQETNTGSWRSWAVNSNHQQAALVGNKSKLENIYMPTNIRQHMLCIYLSVVEWEFIWPDFQTK